MRIIGKSTSVPRSICSESSEPCVPQLVGLQLNMPITVSNLGLKYSRCGGFNPKVPRLFHSPHILLSLFFHKGSTYLSGVNKTKAAPVYSMAYVGFDGRY